MARTKLTANGRSSENQSPKSAAGTSETARMIVAMTRGSQASAAVSRTPRTHHRQETQARGEGGLGGHSRDRNEARRNGMFRMIDVRMTIDDRPPTTDIMMSWKGMTAQAGWPRVTRAIENEHDQEQVDPTRANGSTSHLTTRHRPRRAREVGLRHDAARRGRGAGRCGRRCATSNLGSAAPVSGSA